jgi:hypothetical protein
MDKRIAAIRNEFARRGYELIIEESARGALRCGWPARHRLVADPRAVDGVARGNTKWKRRSWP